MLLRLKDYWLPSVSALCPALLLAGLLSGLSGCGSVPVSAPASPTAKADTLPAVSGKSPSAPIPVLPPAGSGRGGYYQDDGPGDVIPEGLLSMPDPEPKIEPYTTRGNRPYSVFGKTYTPMLDERPFKQRGIGSWYGKKFHGQKTSSGEPYDMYKMTAAHPTLPIPSYVRVTNVNNGKQVIVRVNDRGPFHAGRIIDLSYTAALKLGYLGKGSGELEVERILPDEIARMTRDKKEQLANAERSLPTPEVLAAAAAVDSVSRDNPVVATGARTKTDTFGGIAAPDGASRPDGLSATPIVVTTSPGTAPSVAPGFYLQFGAYTQEANAQAARERLMQAWSGILPSVEVVEKGSFYRLFSGPFSSRADAAAAAQQIQSNGITKPLIVQR